MRRSLACGLFLLLSTTAAFGDEPSRPITVPVPGHSYFNRPGATPDDLRSALELCHTTVSSLSQPMQASGTAGATVGLVPSVLLEVAASAEAANYASAHAGPVNYENCMVVHGWRVVQLDDATGAELEALDQPALAARLEPMTGAESPPGTIVRAYHNDVAQPGVLLVSTAQYGSPSLSIKSLPQESSAAIHPPHHMPRGPMTSWTREQVAQRNQDRADAAAAARANAEVQRRAEPALLGRHEAHRVAANAVAQLHDDSTLIIVRLYGNGFGSGVRLVRADAKDNGVDAIDAEIPVPFFGGHPGDETYVLAVPPGHWRVTGFVAGQSYLTSFCLGAPSFDVAAGDVVFVGTFTFGTNNPRLNMDLAPAQTALASRPALAAKLRAASFTNGETFECGAAAYAYAYEIDGAPFVEGYHQGSQAAATSP